MKAEDNKNYKIHSVKYNLLMNIILKVSTVIFPLITFPYTARTLGAESYGRVGFAVSVVSYFSLVASLGIPTYAVRKCAQKRDDPIELAKTVKEILFINMISLILTYVVFIGALIAIPRLRADYTIMLINSVSIILYTFGVEWFYQAIEQYDYITIRNIIVKIISVIFLFVFVEGPADIVPYSVMTVIGTVGSNLLNFIRLPKLIDLRHKYDLNVKQHIKPIFVLFFYYAATTIYTNLDVVMLGFLTDNTVVGYYNASVKLKNVLVSVVTALGAVALPRASYYLSNKKNEKFTSLIRTSLNYVVLISLSLAIYCTTEAGPIMLLLAGEGYQGAISSMMWILPSIVFIGIGSITAWQLLIPLGRDRCTLVGAVVGAVVDFGINWLLIPKYGATGASIGTLCAEVCVVIVHVIGLRDIIKQYVDRKDIIKIGVGVLAGTTTMLIVDKFLYSDVPLIECMITGASFFGMYAIVEFALKEEAFNKLWRMVVSSKIIRKHR